MKNYFSQLTELNLAKARLNTLEAKKEMYLRRVTSTTSVTKEIMVTGGKAPNKMDEYVINCEKIDKEIAEIKEEIAILEKDINDMNKFLIENKDKGDIEYKVFVSYFVEGKKPKEIYKSLPCGIATVYRKKNKLEKLLKNDSN